MQQCSRGAAEAANDRSPLRTSGDLIAALRKEAADVKDCASRYALQGMVVASAVIVGVGRLQSTIWQVSFACLPFVFVIRAIARTCIHKYQTANRNLGYELHLERMAKLHDDARARPWLRYRNIGWEEAMRAWRIVQTSVFEQVHEVRYQSQRLWNDHNGPSRWLLLPWVGYLWLAERILALPSSINEYTRPVREKVRRIEEHKRPDDGTRTTENDYCWFRPGVNLAGSAIYHAGDFLGVVLKLLHRLAALLLIPPLAGLCQGIWNLHRHSRGGLACVASFSCTPIDDPDSEHLVLLLLQLTIGAGIWLSMLHYVRVANVWDGQRRHLIEDGMLSIHSCSIIWHAVVIAHLRAHEKTMMRLGKKNGHNAGTYERYTQYLGEEADLIARKYWWNIHEYINLGRRSAFRLVLRKPVAFKPESGDLVEISRNGRALLRKWRAKANVGASEDRNLDMLAHRLREPRAGVNVIEFNDSGAFNSAIQKFLTRDELDVWMNSGDSTRAG